MAMTSCKECGRELSTKAEACPNCGARRPRTSGCAIFALGCILLLVLGSILGQCSAPSVHSPPAATPAKPTVASPSTTAVVPPPAPQPGSQWVYRTDEDDMGKGTTHFAWVKSTNTVEFEFPYGKPQHAELTLRSHPRHGKDVLFQIERGQLLCRSYEPCNVLVRFDDREAQRFSALGPSDGSSEVLFIQNYSRFVGALQKAKVVRIAAEVYQQGAPVFEFDVSGFDPGKYQTTK